MDRGQRRYPHWNPGALFVQPSPLPVLSLLLEELLYLAEEGVSILTGDGQPFRVHARLLFPLSDYRGLASIMGR